MASRSSSTGQKTTPTKLARSRKAAATSQIEQGRAGSAGGVMLPKETAGKASTSTPKKATTSHAPTTDDAAASEGKTRRKKPRKLNKDPVPIRTDPIQSNTKQASNDVPSPSELEALKTRVRGLEAKVEELYKTGAMSDSRPGRSPRRRGKGRKASSTAQVPKLNTTAAGELYAIGTRVQEFGYDDAENEGEEEVEEEEEKEEEEEEADEELIRLEGELEVARQDLEHYRPRPQRSRSDDTEYVEEVPRRGTAKATPADRQVTLSGSYRIPMPASVNLEDVQTIQAGVSAAQNMARSFLQQRRVAAAAARGSGPQHSTTTQESRPASATPSVANRASTASTTRVPASKMTRPKRSVSSNMQVAVDNSRGKQSWSDWIGGYSMAITRAVSKIEHEAAVEAQRSSSSSGGGGVEARPASGGTRTSASMSKKAAEKRRASKATLSGEQFHGLMS